MSDDPSTSGSLPAAAGDGCEETLVSEILGVEDPRNASPSRLPRREAVRAPLSRHCLLRPRHGRRVGRGLDCPPGEKRLPGHPLRPEEKKG